MPMITFCEQVLSCVSQNLKRKTTSAQADHLSGGGFLAVRMTADAFGRHGEYCFRLPLGSDGSGLAPAGGKHQFIREDIGWLTQLPASAGTCAMNREENDPMLEL